MCGFPLAYICGNGDQFHIWMKMNAEFHGWCFTGFINRYFLKFQSNRKEIHSINFELIIAYALSISWKLSNAMATCKIFQSAQTYYQFLGFYSPQSNQIHSSKLRTLFFSTFSILFFSSLLGFFLFKAKTIQVLQLLPSTSVFFSYIYMSQSFINVRNTVQAFMQRHQLDIVCFLHSKRIGICHNS